MIALVSQSVNDSWPTAHRSAGRRSDTRLQLFRGHFPMTSLIIGKNGIMGASNYVNLHSVKETRPAEHV